MNCKHCGSERLWRAGYTYGPDGKNQRYQCKDCKRFMNKPNGMQYTLPAIEDFTELRDNGKKPIGPEINKGRDHVTKSKK